MTPSRPLGSVTRGTTAPGRLRRVDRWMVSRHRRLLRTPGLLVVDLGFGATPVTTTELAHRLRKVNADARVVGLEIDRSRVAAAAAVTAPGVSFGVGGFELAGLRPHLVRSLNVLRQYDEAAVDVAWRTLTARVADGGLVVEGTCDESGTLGAWVTLDGTGPRSLTLAVDLRQEPSAVAARLPKALIHRNVPGEPVHDLLRQLDERWAVHAALGGFGRRQRFAESVRDLRGRGWPVLDPPARWRRGEVTLAWHAVRPVSR
jgi:hypothetical protein